MARIRYCHILSLDDKRNWMPYALRTDMENEAIRKILFGKNEETRGRGIFISQREIGLSIPSIRDTIADKTKNKTVFFSFVFKRNKENNETTKGTAPI